MKIKNLLTKIACFCLLLLFAGVAVVPKQAAAAGIIVPMYEYPTIGTLWSDVLASDSNTVPFIIANPGNGPGASVDPIYTSNLNSAVSSGKRVLGYVYANYQARNYQDVYDDIDAWYQMYPQISGIFIDLVQNTTPTELCYAAGLYDHVKHTDPNDLVILNPGTNIAPSIEPYGDIFLNAENTYAVYQSSWTVGYPGWEDNALYRNRFWHAIHTTTLGNYPAALSLTQTNNAGWVYLTDDVMPNPYKVTPSYWSTELTDVAALPATTVPNRGLTQLPSGCQDLSASVSNTTDATAAAKQAKTASAITVSPKSGGALFAIESGSKIAFTLPAGITMSASGTNWTCTGTECTYGNSIALASSAQVLSAAFTATCDYGGDDVSAVLSNFSGNSSSFTISPSRPGDCSNLLADTGITIGTTTGAALGLAAVAFGVRFSRTRLHYVHRLRR